MCQAVSIQTSLLQHLRRTSNNSNLNPPSPLWATSLLKVMLPLLTMRAFLLHDLTMRMAEQEPDDTDGDTDEGEDQLVAYLFDLVEEQRQEVRRTNTPVQSASLFANQRADAFLLQIYELKLKTALASVQSTQDLHDTIAAKLQENDAAWNKRLQDVVSLSSGLEVAPTELKYPHPVFLELQQITRQEEKANAKIEILTQAYEAQLAAMDEEEEEEQEQDNSDDEGEPSSSDESVVLATRKP